MVSPGVCQLIATTRFPPTVPDAGAASPEPVTPCGIQSFVLSSFASSQQKPAGFSAAAREVPWHSGRAARFAEARISGRPRRVSCAVFSSWAIRAP